MGFCGGISLRGKRSGLGGGDGDGDGDGGGFDLIYPRQRKRKANLEHEDYTLNDPEL